MTAKTSQLQIRVTPAEKSVLKRLAGAAGETVSQYVLSRVLPSAELEVVGLLDRLAGSGDDTRGVLVELASALALVRAEDLVARVPDPEALPPVTLNRVAALVETEAHRRGLAPPGWVARVRPLPRPFFVWSLTSLKPHQMRVAPVAFKRRNVFLDPATLPGPGSVPEGPGAVAEVAAAGGTAFAALGEVFANSDIEIEFYFLSGALLFQAFSASPGTANVASMFRPSVPVERAVAEVATSLGLSDTWPHEHARRLLGSGPGVPASTWVERPRVRVFEPLPEYVLAMKCAAMRLGNDFHEHDDIRFLMRAMNVRSVEAAMAVVARYFDEHQLASDTRERLQALISA